MARTYEEMMARMDELEKAQAAATAAPVPAAPVARVPAAPKPAVAPGMEALPKPSAAPPAPTVTRRAVSVTPKVEEIKAPKPPEVEAPKPVGLTPDLAKPIDYKKVYDAAETPLVKQTLRFAASDMGMSESELQRVAQAQGVDLDAIVKARQKGRTYDEIAKAGRERGVIGFMPVEEREKAFNKLAQDVEKAQRGDAGDTVELVRSGADKGFGVAGALGGYTFAGTQAELPEVAKPGEHGYAVAQILVDALQKDPSAVRAFDLYGRSLATGNTQRYIDDRVEDLRKRANVKASDADAMEKMAALRKRAINEVIAYKTVGQWTPVVTLGDVEVREGRASPGALAALKPNIEIIGFNNKRQAIFRQESPMGVLFRAIDVPQAAIAGVLSGQTVGQGIQSGANLLEYSLDATKDSAMYVKAPVVAAGFAASILFPDALVAAGAAGKAVKAVSKIRAARKIAPEATALLETIVRTRKAGDYEAAAAAEKQLRSLLPDVASNLDSADAAVARFQKLAEPESDILDTDLAALIAGAAPEQARVVAGRPFLHPSLRKFVVGPSGLEQADYAELFDTRRQLDRVQRAKAEYIKARTTGRSVTDYTKDYVRGRVHDVFENLPAERQLSLTQVNRMADLISAQAPAALLDQKQFKKAVEDALKADAEFGTDAYKMARQDAYKAIGGRTETKLDEIRGKTIEELEAADMGLFDRAIKAIEQNNTARGVAAQLLRDEIAGAARLRVEPLELFDEVAPKLSSGEPIRLTPGGLLLLHHLRQAYPKQDFKEAYATITIIDKMIEGAAQAREVSPLALYQEIFPLIKRGTPEDLKRLAGDLKAGKVPTGGAPTGGAPAAPAAPTKAARARAEAKLREMMRRLGDEELDEIEGMLRADGVQEGEAYALDAIKREKQRRAREAKKAAAATPAAPSVEEQLADVSDEELANAIKALEEGPSGPMLDDLRAEQARRAAEAPTPVVVEEVVEAPVAAPTVEAPAPTIAEPPTPAPIAAAAEVQPEAAKIVEAPAPAKRKRATRVKAAAEAAPVAEAETPTFTEVFTGSKKDMDAERLAFFSDVAPSYPPWVVAEVGGEVVGAAYVGRGENSYRFDIIVTPKAQGTGVGARLLDQVISDYFDAEAARPGLTISAEVVSPLMKQMLERRGFKERAPFVDRYGLDFPVATSPEGFRTTFMEATSADLIRPSVAPRAMDERKVLPIGPVADADLLRRADELSQRATEEQGRALDTLARDLLPAGLPAGDARLIVSKIVDINVHPAFETARRLEDEALALRQRAFEAKVAPEAAPVAEAAPAPAVEVAPPSKAPSMMAAVEVPTPAQFKAEDARRVQEAAARTEAVLSKRPDLAAEVEQVIRAPEWREVDKRLVAESGRFTLTLTSFKSRSKKNPVYYNFDVTVQTEVGPRRAFLGTFKSLDEAKSAVSAARLGVADAALEAEAVVASRKALAETDAARRADEAARRTEAQEVPTEAVPPAPQIDEAQQAALQTLRDLGVDRLSPEEAIPEEFLSTNDFGEWVDPRLTNVRFAGLGLIGRPRKGRSADEMLDLLTRANGDLATAVREVASTTTVPEFRVVAERILALEDEMRETPLVLVRPGSAEAATGMQIGAAGWYDPSANTVNIFGPEYTSVGLSEETLLHEVLHSLTHKRLHADNIWETGRLRLTKASEESLRQGRRAIYGVFEDLKKHIERVISDGTATPFERSPAMKDYLLDQSPDELISWALTDAGFQDYLKSVKLPKSAATMWQRFVRSLGVLLGFDLEETNALARVVEASDQLLGAKYEPLPPAATLAYGAVKDAASQVQGVVFALGWEIGRLSRSIGETAAVKQATAFREAESLVRGTPGVMVLQFSDHAPFNQAVLRGDYEEAQRMLEGIRADQDLRFKAAVAAVDDLPIPARRNRPATSLRAHLKEKYDRDVKAAFDTAQKALDEAERVSKLPEAAPAVKPPDVFPSIEPLARTAPSPWAEVPQRFVVAAETRLRKAAEDLDAGRINVVDYDVRVGDVRKDLTAQKAARDARKAEAPLVRGASEVRAKLLRAQAAGVIDEAGVDLADWLIRQNPRIADDLNVAILTPESAKKRFGVDVGEAVGGFYEPLERIVALIKERGSEETAVHEILHHTERMLPEALQTAVRDEWAKQLTAALRRATPEQRPLLEKALTGQSSALLQGVGAGTLPRAFYQFSNPSEFWAVNASRIVSGRYAAFNKGLIARAKQWLTEFVQKVKSAFKLPSDAPLIRGLDAVLKGDGTFVSKQMLSEGGVFRSVEPDAASIDRLLRAEADANSRYQRALMRLRTELPDADIGPALDQIPAEIKSRGGPAAREISWVSDTYQRAVDNSRHALTPHPALDRFADEVGSIAETYRLVADDVYARIIEARPKPLPFPASVPTSAPAAGGLVIRLNDDRPKAIALRDATRRFLDLYPDKAGRVDAEWLSGNLGFFRGVDPKDVREAADAYRTARFNMGLRPGDRVFIEGIDPLPGPVRGASEAANLPFPTTDALKQVSREPASRLTMSLKDVTKRIPELTEAAENLKAGKITKAEYDAMVNRFKPVLPYEAAPTPTTDAEMRAALKADQIDKIGAPRTIAEGTPVGLRLDIPAYTNYGAWVVTVHQPGPVSGVGPVIGYDSVGAVRNAQFEVGERAALGIAAGARKGTIAKVKGSWVPMTPEQAKAAADAALTDPAWRQVGMDPERHSYFYDRATTQPIVAAEEVIQIGPLVLAKNPTYAPKEQFLYQVSPTGEVKGAVEWLEDGSSVIYLFEGADASTVLHEVAHVVRRNILSNEDMGFIASWVQGLGVNVGHQYGEFTGDAAEIEKAEELFAKAFEQYVAEGKAPAGLEGAFAQLKDAVANVYKAVKDPVIGVELQPEVRRVFDGLFATEPKQADQSLKEAIRRGILGGPEAEVDILTVLSREAKRKGLDQFSPDELATRINEAKANIKQIAKRDPTGTDVVLKFETKVLGKDKWTINDLAAAQAARDARLAPQAEARMALLRDMTGKGRGKAAIYKQDTAVESLWTALSSKETDAPMTKQAKKALRGVASLYFGGSVLEETKMAGQPPAFRRALDTSARIVEQSLADTVALVNDAVATGDDTQLLRYLTGDSDVAKVSGRPILSSGHDKMGAVNRMIQRAIAAFKDDEKEALIELADAINTKDPVERGQKLVTLGFTAAGGEVPFKEADEARKAMSDALRRAVGKLLYPEKKDADIGTALAAAIRDSVNAPDKARPSHELRLVETLTYIGGVTARDGDLFKGDSKDVVRTLLGDIRKIYGEIGEESARRVAVQIGAFGGADQAKQFLVRMGLGVDEKTQAAFSRFLNGEQPGAENIAGVDRMLNTFGRDIQFVPDAALDVDFYIPRAARERMAQVLSRAQFRTEESVGAADALATSYRYMKTRMTRGNFFIRQRYFMMNTVDHFNAMAYTEGFGIAAASTARVIAQDLLVVPLMREILEVGKAAGVLSPVATERLRSSLQKLGDRAAGRIGKMMSVSKYRIEVNPILEGVDGGFTVGGKVYRYRDIRDIAVEEGVFSSFDTRELQRAILREGQLVLGDAAAQKAVVRSPTRLAWMRNGLASLEESVSDIAEAWGERERLGAMVTLMEAGYDPRAAAQITVKALFDYSQSMTKLDRLWLVNLLLPFWAFQKNANQQVFNMLFSPWGGYRMMVVKRARERTSDLLGNIMYNTLVDDYGVDVESMPPELQDSYYATIKAFEEAFGPDGPPPEAKRAMRMLLSGRAIDVEGGVLMETSAEIQRLRSAGAFADLARFIPFTVAEPSKASRSSIMRDRAGFPVPFPRSEGVRTYNALLGDNHSYMELYWPDSTIEAGMKWHTQVAATMFLLAAEGAAETGLTGLREGGIDEVTVQRVLQPIIDVERSPLIAPFLEQPPPKRIAAAATPEAWMKVHPMLGKMLDDVYGTTFLRVPAVADPLLVDEDGNLPQLTPDQITEIKRLQEQYPDIGVLKNQRYYLPGGVWATAFENSPLGELNALLLRWEEEPLESQGRQTIQGKILIWSRKYAGVDVTLTAPSQAAKREEPRKKTETAGTKTF